MSLFGPRRIVEVNPDPNADRRPSHWQEDQNERDVPPTLEYPTEQSTEPPVYGMLPPPEPQPVYLTEPPPNGTTLRRWSPGSIGVSAAMGPVQLAGQDRRRTRIVIVNNDDTDTVYLSKGPDDNRINAYPLAPGKDVELLHNDDVYVETSSADTAEVGWFVEFDLED